MTIHTRVIHIHTTPNYNWRIISHCCHYYYILDYFFYPLYTMFTPSPLLCSYKIFIICSFTLLRFAIAACLFRFIVSRSPLAKSSVVNALNLLLLLSHFHPPYSLFASGLAANAAEANVKPTAARLPRLPLPLLPSVCFVLSFPLLSVPNLSSAQFRHRCCRR